MTQAMVGGYVEDFDVYVRGDVIRVLYNGDGVRAERTVRGLEDFVRKNAGKLRLVLGWTVDFTVVYLLDESDFGYAVNLEAPELSEWGYGPGDSGGSGVVEGAVNEQKEVA